MRNLLTITNPSNVAVEELLVKVGRVCKRYALPTFPLRVSLSACETAKLNVGHAGIGVAIVDSTGQHTSLDMPHVYVRNARVNCRYKDTI